ncbi:hypothetical protein M9Y10_008028 [Tritrichomonas musculus]|uniref:Uncharacterized protein n=1 Tax=Tritrichomonas musculus TaxID=1915356 RepID=A0ABR2IX88_9EUKA
MKIKGRTPSILYLKNNQANWCPPNKQTLHIRENANFKIRILGNKYFEIKNLFEKLNIHRDTLFNAAKEIENNYKELKKLSPLRNQSKRLKDSLIIWFTENFYEELTNKNPHIFRIIKSAQGCELLSKFQSKQVEVVRKPKPKTKVKNIYYVSEEKGTQELNDNVLANTEIDDYTTVSNEESSSNMNFDFNKFF